MVRTRCNCGLKVENEHTLHNVSGDYIACFELATNGAGSRHLRTKQSERWQLSQTSFQGRSWLRRERYADSQGHSAGANQFCQAYAQAGLENSHST